MPMRTKDLPKRVRRRLDLSTPLWALAIGAFVCAMIITGSWQDMSAVQYIARVLLIALAGTAYGTLGLLLAVRPRLVVRHATAMSRFWRKRLPPGLTIAWAGYIVAGSSAAGPILRLSRSDAARLATIGLVVAAVPLVVLALANWWRRRRETRSRPPSTTD